MMFSFPATPEVDLEAVTSGRGLRGTRHADGHENAEKGSRFEADADAGAAFARLLEGAFACEDGDTEVLSRIVSSGHEAGVDPEDLGKLFQLLESFGPINADGASAGDAAEPDTDVSFPGSGGIAEDLSDIPERLGRILAGLRAGSTEAGRPGMHAFFGEPFADLSQRNKISEHPVRQGAHPASADAALARIVSAFSRNAGEGRSVKHHAAQAAASGNPMAEGRTTDETAMKMRAFGGASGRMEDVRGVSPDISGGGFRERFGGGSDKAAVSSGKESLKMRAYLDTLAEQLAGEGKKETSGRMGLKMTGFRDGAADAAQLSGEPARAQGSPGTQVHGAAASTTGSISIPGGAMGAETSAFGGDGGFQGAMAESSGGKAAPTATDAGNPGSSSAAAFDKHLQSPAQLLENRVVGQVFMRLFTGAGRGIVFHDGQYPSPGTGLGPGPHRFRARPDERSSQCPDPAGGGHIGKKPAGASPVPGGSGD